MAPHSSTLAWKIPWMEEAGRLQSLGSLRVGHDWETSLSLFTFMHWRRKWQSTRVLAWRIPEKGKPGGLPSLGSHRVGHDWSDLAAAAAAAVVCLNFSLLKIIFEKQPLIIKTLANSVIFYALTSCFFFTALILCVNINSLEVENTGLAHCFLRAQNSTRHILELHFIYSLNGDSLAGGTAPQYKQ